MSEAWCFPETRAAWARLKFNFRVLLTEWLISKALDICPKGYIPSIIEGVIEEIKAQAAKSKEPA